MIDGNGFVDFDHHGVVHAHHSDEVAVAVRQVDSVHLETN